MWDLGPEALPNCNGKQKLDVLLIALTLSSTQTRYTYSHITLAKSSPNLRFIAMTYVKHTLIPEAFDIDIDRSIGRVGKESWRNLSERSRCSCREHCTASWVKARIRGGRHAGEVEASPRGRFRSAGEQRGFDEGHQFD